MKLRITIPKQIPLSTICMGMFFICTLLHHVLMYVGAQWEMMNFTVVQSASHGPVVAILCAGGLGAFIAALFFRQPELRLPLFEALCVVVLIVEGVVWTTRTMGNHTLKDVLFEPGTPIFWVCSFAVLVGFSDHLWSIFKQLMLVVGCILLLLVLWEMVKFDRLVGSVIYANRITRSALLYWFIYAFWLIASYIFLDDEAIMKHGKLLIVCSVALAAVGLIVRSRGWMIQTLVLLVYTLFRSRLRWRDRGLAIAVYIFLGLLALFLFRDSLRYIAAPMLERLGDDTRSAQLIQFFGQVSWQELIVGGGMDATYSFSAIDSNYQYIDNQFILEMFRYGIVPILVYTVLMLRPFIHAVVNFDFDLMRRSIVLMLWLLAMGGVSVFFSLSINIACVAMYAVCGRLNHFCYLPKEKRW